MSQFSSTWKNKQQHSKAVMRISYRRSVDKTPRSTQHDGKGGYLVFYLNAASNVRYCTSTVKDVTWKIAAAARNRKNSPSSHTRLHLDINNELYSGCCDNSGFITFKPRRGTQLVCAAQAVRTEYACIGSPCLPQANYSPPCNTPPAPAPEHNCLY